MSDIGLPRVGVDDVERLLSARYADLDEPCEQLQLIARAIGGAAADDDTARASAHLEICAGCREALLTLQAFDATLAQHAPAAHSGRRQATRPVRSRRAWLGYASGAAVLLTIVVGGTWLLRPVEQQPAGTGLMLKGSVDALAIGVQRGDKRFTARPLDTLVEHDQLGLFYSAQQPGYLAVLNRDGAGRVVVLFPAGAARSGAIEPGANTPLPDGAIVRAGQGCEWLVAVFSDQPLALEQLLQSVSSARAEAARCDLELDIDQARAIDVLPVLR